MSDKEKEAAQIQAVQAQRNKMGGTLAKKRMTEHERNTIPHSESVLRYPSDMATGSEARECIRFCIVDRKTLNEKKQIYLYTPAGIAISDAAGYNQADLGLVGGVAESVADAVARGNDDSNLKGKTLTELISAATTKAAGKAGTVGQAGMMAAGLASNPFTNVTFAGTNLRSFAFGFKLVASSQKESDDIRLIENTFRKFLYPKKAFSSDYLLEYPPLFKIEFLSINKEAANRNSYMPMIQYSYLLNMTATFNSATNIFHRSGAPTELDLALTFQESKALRREDLYEHGSEDNYADPNYHYDYITPFSFPGGERQPEGK